MTQDLTLVQQDRNKLIINKQEFRHSINILYVNSKPEFMLEGFKRICHLIA